MRKLLVLVAALGAAGCFKTTIRSGLPAAAAPAVEYDGKWHHGLLWGLAEISGPYDLSAICPQGWAEVKTKTGFVDGLLSGITYSIYTPQTVTIICASGTAPPGAVTGPVEGAVPPAEGAPAP
jgi:hypothetical protein